MPPVLIATFVALLAIVACVPALAIEPSPTPVNQPPPTTNVQPTPVPTPAMPTFQAFRLKAREIAFYSARYILTADGNVEVKLGDGTRITGNTFAMDIRLNRFVIAGNVTLVTATQTYTGAAFADFFDFDRQYFVPVGDEPDRWTYIHDDFAHPYRGRLMPGDTFFLPDVSRDRIFAVSQTVIVQPRESIKFVTPTLNFGLAKLPWPTYFLNFSANPNFAQNSLPGAFVDGPYDIVGGGHSLLTAHIRYDNVDGLFFGAEAHQVSDRHYLVASVSPLTRPFKTYNFDAFDRMSPETQVQGSYQESVFQDAFKPALSASAYANLKFTLALKRSFLLFNGDQFWESVLKQPQVAVDVPSCNNCAGLYFYGDPTHNWVPNHPQDTQLTWTGYQNRVFKKIPFLLSQLRSGVGEGHDGYGEFALNGASTSTVWDRFIGLNLAAPQIDLIHDRSGQRRDLFLNVAFDKQREWYSIPHHLDVTSTGVSLSESPERHFSLLASYTISNVADFWGNNQPIIYPSIFTYSSPMTGQVYPSWSAFNGFQTQRSLVGQVLFTSSPSFVTSIQYRHDHDFPEPIPGLAPMLNTLAWQNYGLTPNQLTVDLRFRVTPILTVDFSDAYYFNFGGYEKWSPYYQVQALR